MSSLIVKEVQGTVIAEDINGNTKVLKAGDELLSTDTIITGSADQLVLETANGEITIPAETEFSLFELAATSTPDSLDETTSQVAGESLDEVLALLDGEGDLLDDVDAAAAGEADNDGMSEAFRIARITEKVVIGFSLYPFGPRAEEERDFSEPYAQDKKDTSEIVAEITIDEITLNPESDITIITGTVGGDVKPGDTVIVIVNDKEYETTVNGDGKTWDVEVPTEELIKDEDKKIEATVTTEDEEGNTATAEDEKDYELDPEPEESETEDTEDAETPVDPETETPPVDPEEPEVTVDPEQPEVPVEPEAAPDITITGSSVGEGNEGIATGDTVTGQVTIKLEKAYSKDFTITLKNEVTGESQVVEIKAGVTELTVDVETARTDDLYQQGQTTETIKVTDSSLEGIKVEDIADATITINDDTDSITATLTGELVGNEFVYTVKLTDKEGNEVTDHNGVNFTLSNGEVIAVAKDSSTGSITTNDLTPTGEITITSTEVLGDARFEKLETTGTAEVENYAPTLDAKATLSGREDEIVTGQVKVTDANNDELSYSLKGGTEVERDGKEFFELELEHGTVVLDKNTGEYSYTPVDNWNSSVDGAEIFVVQVSDGVNTVKQTVTVDVSAVDDVGNDHFAGIDDKGRGVESGGEKIMAQKTVILDVLKNDTWDGDNAPHITHINGQAITVGGEPIDIFSLESFPGSGNGGNKIGSVTLNIDGTLTLTTVDLEFDGFDTLAGAKFSYTATTEGGTPETADVTLALHANSGTVWTPTGLAVLSEDGVFNSQDAKHNMKLEFHDLDGFSADNPPVFNGLQHGTAEVVSWEPIDGTNGTGWVLHWKYTPDADYYGFDSFTVTATDNLGGTHPSGEIKIVVGEDPSDAKNDTASTMVNTTTIIDVLGNDGWSGENPSITEINDTAITVGSTVNVNNGTVKLIEVEVTLEDGTTKTVQQLEFTPADGYEGDAEFTYTANTEKGIAETAKVTVTVAEDEDEDEAEASGDTDATEGNAASTFSMQSFSTFAMEEDADVIPLNLGDTGTDTVKNFNQGDVSSSYNSEERDVLDLSEILSGTDVSKENISDFLELIDAGENTILNINKGGETVQTIELENVKLADLAGASDPDSEKLLNQLLDSGSIVIA